MPVRKFVRQAMYKGVMREAGTIINVDASELEAARAEGPHPRDPKKWLHPLMNHTVAIDGTSETPPEPAKPMAMSDMNKVPEIEVQKRIDEAVKADREKRAAETSATEAEEAKEPTKAELQAALDEKGIAYKTTDNKTTLKELLTGAE